MSFSTPNDMTIGEKAQHENIEAISRTNSESFSSSAGHVTFAHVRDSSLIRRQSGRISKFIESTTLGRYFARKTGTPLDIDECEPRRTWTTTWLRFGPLSGIFMICLSVMCLLGCLGILVGSDGRSTQDWSVPPSTGIAIFTAVSNLSIRYAALQGVVIAWWTRAARGSTFDRLHYDWRSGMSLRGAVTSGRHMGLLGLACIFSTLVVIDGPFLQRSTSVVLAPNPNTVDLDVWMAEEIPHNLTGSWGLAKDYYSSWEGFSYGFNRSVPAATSKGEISNSLILASSWWMNAHSIGPWFANQPLSRSIRGCPKTCSVKIRAPALAPVACESFIVPVDYHNPRNWSFFERHAQLAPPLSTEQFLITPDLVVLPDREEINLVTGSNSLDGDCKGIFNYTTCTLRSAIGEYDVRISGEELSLVGEPVIVALANNTATDYVWNRKQEGQAFLALNALAILLTCPSYFSTLAGVVAGAAMRWNVMCWIEASADGSLSPWCRGATGGILQFQSDTSACTSYRDPRAVVMASLNTLMFSAGSAAALHHAPEYLEPLMDAGLSSKKTVVGNIDGDHTVFQSNYPFFVVAAVIQAATISMVAPTYWGWWRLGRSMSFSPLELAKAFEAPVFDDINSNASGRDIAKAKHNERIRYGVLTDRTGTSRLAFADPALVKHPEALSQFDV